MYFEKRSFRSYDMSHIWLNQWNLLLVIKQFHFSMELFELGWTHSLTICLSLIHFNLHEVVWTVRYNKNDCLIYCWYIFYIDPLLIREFFQTQTTSYRLHRVTLFLCRHISKCVLTDVYQEPILQRVATSNRHSP